MIIITNYYKHVMKHHNKHVLSCYIELFYTKHRSFPPTLIVLQIVIKPYWIVGNCVLFYDVGEYEGYNMLYLYT